MPVPTWRAGVAAAAAAPLLLALPLGFPWGLVAVNLVLLAALVVDAALAVDPADLVVERDLPGIVPLGDCAELRWRVRNPTARRVHMAMADQLAPSLQAATRRGRFELPPRGRGAATTTLRPARRGRFQPTTVTVRVEGPLRLAARQRELAVPTTLHVYPAFRSRREAELRIERARILEVGLRSARGRGGGTEFDRLRDYGVDDEFRRVDWAATARMGKPIVREYRAERNQSVVVLLDTGRTMAGRITLAAVGHRDGSQAATFSAGLPLRRSSPAPWGGGPAATSPPRLDHAMDAVMALTTVADRLGDRVGLVAFGAQVRAVLPAGHGGNQLARVTRVMYRLEPELEASDYRGALLETLARFRRRALLVLLTELSEETVEETLLPALPLVARSHVLVVASVQDPQVLAWAQGVPEQAGAAYRKAAAVDTLAGRRRAAGRLAGYGAEVVDAPPALLAGRLTDVYLKVKATARL